MPSDASAGTSLGGERLGVLHHQRVALGEAAGEHVARVEPAGGRHGDAGGDAALQAGDPHHEELVEVAGEDAHEAHPLEQRDVRVLRRARARER